MKMVDVGVLPHRRPVNFTDGGGDALTTVSRWSNGPQFDAVLDRVSPGIGRNQRDIVAGHRQALAFLVKNARIKGSMHGGQMNHATMHWQPSPCYFRRSLSAGLLRRCHDA